MLFPYKMVDQLFDDQYYQGPVSMTKTLVIKFTSVYMKYEQLQLKLNH